MVFQHHTRIKNTLGFAVIFLAISVLYTATTFANSGPHGNYSALTDACAGCHRAHTAGNEKLLIDSVPNLCLTCHGSGAPGASTDVMNGAYGGGGNLLGGGFDFYQGQPTTSSHSIDGSWKNAWGSGTAWGSTYDCAGCHNADSGLVWPGAPTWGISPGALPTYPGRGQNVTMPLTCTSCHDPHGGENYRILQQRMHPDAPALTDSNGLVLVQSNETGGTAPDQPGYAPNYTTPNYRIGLGDWCRGCHFTYHQEVSVQPFNAEDGKGLITRYRHKVDMTLGGLSTGLPLEDPAGDGTNGNEQVFCVTCHFAHGSTASMTGQATVAPTNDSALLRMDNRGVCEDCHQK